MNIIVKQTENIMNKKKFLICSIFRNRQKFVYRWYEQILQIVENCKDIDFSLSIYENDSVDGTRYLLENLNYLPFENVSKIYENLNTFYYGSIQNEDRVKNLANARNKCLFNENIEISKYDKVLFIEPDFAYSLEDAKKIILHDKDVDIISGVSIYRGNFYDSWATRITENDTSGRVEINNSITPCWSTFNGFCLYNAKPFKEGAKFGWYNDRLKTYDCDTVVICENFRKNGYNSIYVNCSAVFFHED